MNARIKEAWDAFARVLYDTSIPEAEYVAAVEEIVETLQADLSAAGEMKVGDE